MTNSLSKFVHVDTVYTSPDERRGRAISSRKLSKERRFARTEKDLDRQCVHWIGKNYYGPNNPSKEEMQKLEANGWETRWQVNHEGDWEVIGWRTLLDATFILDESELQGPLAEEIRDAVDMFRADGVPAQVIVVPAMERPSSPVGVAVVL
jgi:hypothetical protein